MAPDSVIQTWLHVQQLYPATQSLVSDSESLEFSPVAAILQEIFVLIVNQFKLEYGSCCQPQMNTRQDIRRNRLVLSFSSEMSADVKTDAPLKAFAADLREERSRYIQVLTQVIGISCIQSCNDSHLTGYTIVMPLVTEQKTPEKAQAPADPQRISAGESQQEKKDRKRAQLKQFFIDSLPHDMEKLTSALHDGDWETVRQIAHQLKGCAASFGFPDVTEQAMTVDNLIKSGQISAYPAACHTLLNRLKQIA
jgi:HPt (histidine-containing phosphotransfer) domain-containing protein